MCVQDMNIDGSSDAVQSSTASGCTLPYNNSLQLMKQLYSAIKSSTTFARYIKCDVEETTIFLKDNELFLRYCISPQQLSMLSKAISDADGLSNEFLSKMKSMLRCTPTVVNDVIVCGAYLYVTFNYGEFQFTRLPDGSELKSGVFLDLMFLLLQCQRTHRILFFRLNFCVLCIILIRLISF